MQVYKLYGWPPSTVQQVGNRSSLYKTAPRKFPISLSDSETVLNFETGLPLALPNVIYHGWVFTYLFNRACKSETVIIAVAR